ncbi:MAG: DUF4199 domain-containing protein [Taibaiella sp.]|nr:DUF4199 domain-containing protein [Taibaiella sp.]
MKKDTFLMYGIICGVVSIIISLVVYMANAMFTPGVNYISYAAMLAIIIINNIAYSKANDGFVTFGNVFKSGFKASAVAGAIVVVWSIASLYIMPDMKATIMENMAKEMNKQQNLPDEQIEMAMKMTEKFWSYFMVLGVIAYSLGAGAIFSLIGAAIAKKKGERPFTADTF